MPNLNFINHSKPRSDDHVYVSERERDGKNPLGQVLQLDYESHQVMVLFFGDGYQLCAQRGNANFCYDCIHTNPGWYNGGGDVEEYSLEQFEGNWSSHDGGTGQWEI